MTQSMQHFTRQQDPDGIITLIWDMDDKSMNVFTQSVMDELDQFLDDIADDDAVKGVVIASGKKHFSGGADLTMLSGLLQQFHATKADDMIAAKARLLKEGRRLSDLFRRIETCGKPWVAAIHGICLGGACELALSCHGRIASNSTPLKLGLPEVKVGLFPGAGGTQRIMRMCEAQAGLTMLLKGQDFDVKKAKAMGLIDLETDQGQLIHEAKNMILQGLSPIKPWDEKGYKLKGAAKIYSPAGFQFWPAANAIYARETFDNYPGARGIMHSVYEGLLLPFDQALTIEARYFAHVMQQPECEAMIRSLFISMQALNKGARRPEDLPKQSIKTVAIIGAGFMGCGIASVSAKSGLSVLLLDQNISAAEKGKERIASSLEALVKKGRITQDEHEAIVKRVHPINDYGLLSEADLVIEAVFEERNIKNAVLTKAEQNMRDDVILASNTSTLPITSLAESLQKPEQFIGLHFFSPVERMKLVEVIMGGKTSDQAVATALDFTQIIKKTPIVVNDTRGFYINRCVMAYLLEAHLMVMEGVPPAMIENLAKQAGMPVGPLSLTDEIGVDLAWKILQATKDDLGPDAIEADQEALLHKMVVELERLGRKNGKGFYDYQGRNKALWQGMAEIVVPKPAEEFDRDEITNRLLLTQALEAARVMEEGVVTDPREADVGSILGYGFAPYSGGTLSFMDMMGIDQVAQKARALQKTHGDRFAPPPLLDELAQTGQSFYQRFG